MIISNDAYDKEVFVLCDCGCTILRFFLEFVDGDYEIGVSLFRSYKNKKFLGDPYFYSKEDFKSFVKHLGMIDSGLVLITPMTNSYLTSSHFGDGFSSIAIYKDTRHISRDKKPIGEVIVKDDNLKALADELKEWISLYLED